MGWVFLARSIPPATERSRKQVKTGENTGITAGNKLVAAGNRGKSFQ